MKLLFKIIRLFSLIFFITFLMGCSEKYTVTFVDDLGNVISKQSVNNSQDLIIPSDPLKDGFEFIGWSNDLKEINEDLIVVARFEKNSEFKQIDFDLDGGTIISGNATVMLQVGDTPVAPVVYKEGYEFIGWDQEIQKVSSDCTYKAIYKELTIKRIKAIDFINDLTFGWSYVDGMDEDNDLDKLCNLLKEKNINVLQLPVVWMNYCDDDYKIKDEALEKLKFICDKVISNGLYIVICSYDSYDDEWSSLKYSNQKKLLDVMNIQWTQIGTLFKDYDEKVIFSFLNEPRDYDDNGLDGEAYHVLNYCNNEYVKLIRSLGGNNLYRHLIITIGWGKYNGDSYKYLEVPDDEYLSVGVHAYVPFSLVHDVEKDSDGNYLEASWNNLESVYKIEILETMYTIKTNFIDQNIPVILSEFGSRDKNNTTDRAKWLEYYLSVCHSFKIKCFIWDSAKPHMNRENTFSLINREDYTWLFKELTDVISDLYCDNKFINFYQEIHNYTQSINDEVVLPKELTNILTNKKVGCRVSYDESLIVSKENKLYATKMGPIIIKVDTNNYTYYYQIMILPDYEMQKTDLTLEVKENDSGVLQCFITTKLNSIMRVDYDWYSFDESIIQVNKYSSLTILKDGTTAIMAINKENKKVGIVEVTIKSGKVVSQKSTIQYDPNDINNN